MAHGSGHQSFLARFIVALSKGNEIIILKKIRFLLLGVGIALLTFMIYRIGPGNIVQEFSKLGFYAFFVFIPYFFVYLFDALAWQLSLGDRANNIKFSNNFLVRMAGEAINYITPFAYLGGEPLKAYLLKKYGIPMVDGLASIVVAKTMMVIAQVLFVVVGIGIAFLHQPNTHEILYGAILVIAFIAASMTFLVFIQQRGMFSGILRFMEFLHLPSGFLKRREEQLKIIDSNIMKFYGQHKTAFFLTLLFFFLGWLVGSLEIYLLLLFLGLPIDLPSAVALEALTTVVRAAVFFIPGSLGIQEGGNILLFAAYGYSSVAAMTFSIIRRVREALWVGIGLLYLTKQEARLP
jgi:putative membrane protein